ncbi:MAG TPA: hypothetical protein VGM56_32790 [Byssovorax sp.]|jgi:hypothetical protein
MRRVVVGAAVALIACLAAVACSNASDSTCPNGLLKGETFLGVENECCECVGGPAIYTCGGGLTCDGQTGGAWWASCGDGACQGYAPLPGALPCTSTAGAACSTIGATCVVDGDPCNRSEVCEPTDPYACDAGP